MVVKCFEKKVEGLEQSTPTFLLTYEMLVLTQMTHFKFLLVLSYELHAQQSAAWQQ